MNRLLSDEAAVPDSSRHADGRTRQLTIILPLLSTLALPLHSQQSPTADDDKLHFELMPYLVLGANRATLNAGWKFYYVDYKDSGANFRYAALSQGPLLGATFCW